MTVGRKRHQDKGPHYPCHGLAAEDEHNELLEEAIELVKRHKRASTSFLQRRLRIGYPRAALLIDMMEEQGIIGPPASGGHSREVLIEDFKDAESSYKTKGRKNGTGKIW